MVIPAGIDRGEVSAFLKLAAAASGDGPILRGYADAVKTSALASRAGKPMDWIFIMLISDFVSEQK